MNRQRGFTLIETVIFVVVVGIGIAGISQLILTSAQQSSTPLIRERTMTIAKGYMDEIIAKRWDENTPVGGGCVDTDGDLTDLTDSCNTYCSGLSDLQCTRSKCSLTAPGTCRAVTLSSGALGAELGEANRAVWDDIDDYQPYGWIPPQAIDNLGVTIPGYADYSVRVRVTQPGAAWNGVPATDTRRIAVSVRNPLGETLTLITYKVNF